MVHRFGPAKATFNTITMSDAETSQRYAAATHSHFPGKDIKMWVFCAANTFFRPLGLMVRGATRLQFALVTDFFPPLSPLPEH